MSASEGGKVGRVKLGSQGLEVSRQGFGCMGMTAAYGKVMSDQEGLQLLTEVYKQGITFWDTAQLYLGLDLSRVLSLRNPIASNEELLSGAIKAIGRENLQIATKTGVRITSYLTRSMVADSSPAFIRQSCGESLKKLGVDYIDLYYLHRMDQNVPIEVSMATMKELVEEGKVRYVGLSECSPDTLRRAHAVHPVTAVQMEWSLWSREIEQELVDVCKELGVGIVAYSPLGRGFLTGTIKSKDQLAKGDYRRENPRFADEAAAKNAKLVESFSKVAEEQKITPAQLALAWVHHQEARLGGAGVVPIPGTTKAERVVSNAAAASVQLSDEVAKRCEEAIPPDQVVGSRYAPGGMKTFQEESNPQLEGAKADGEGEGEGEGEEGK